MFYLFLVIWPLFLAVLFFIADHCPARWSDFGDRNKWRDFGAGRFIFSWKQK